MACKFSTCLLLWQDKEVGYSWNSPTCPWHWIWPKWPKKPFCAMQQRKQNISLRNHAPRSEKRRSGVLSLVGTKRWRLWYKDTRQCFVKTTRPAAFLSKMSPQWILRHPGDGKEQVYLPPTDTDSGIQSRCHLSPACHPPHPVTLLELNIPKSSICRPDICIHIWIIPLRNFSIMTRIARTIPILIQIC